MVIIELDHATVVFLQPHAVVALHRSILRCNVVDFCSVKVHLYFVVEIVISTVEERLRHGAAVFLFDVKRRPFQVRGSVHTSTESIVHIANEVQRLRPDDLFDVIRR